MSKHASYERKRDLDKTPEPAQSGGRASSASGSVFVIQKHDARNLHYDFRLEIDGTLKSWVVPKGPSTDPSQKRLAIPTEDHPLDYADFEGVIPEGQYGAGTVMVWDRGSYENIKTQDNHGDTLTMSDCYEKGQIEITLNGEKIRGNYALIRTDSDRKDGNWLLIKMDDEEADARRNPVSTENKSVKTGRTIEEILKDNSQNK